MSGFASSQYESRDEPERASARGRGWLLSLGFADGASLAWRLRGLAGVALLGCLGVFGLARWLAQQPVLDLGPPHAATGSEVIGVVLHGPDGDVGAAAAALEVPVTRWHRDAVAARAAFAEQARVAAGLSAARSLSFVHGDGLRSQRQLERRGWRGLGVVFWPLMGGALLLFLLAAAVWLARPHLRNALYLGLAWTQTLQVATLAVAALPGFSPVHAQLATLLPLLAVLEVAAVALVLLAVGLHPQRLLAQAAWAGLALAATLAAAAVLAVHATPPPLAGIQVCLALLAGAAVWRAHSSYRRHPNPLALLLRRTIAAALAAGVGLSILVGVVGGWPGSLPRPPGWPGEGAAALALVVPVAWHALLLTLLLLVPLLARSRQQLREFAMLAGISAVATSLDLLFVTLFALGPFTSLALAVFAALALYAGLRQWLLARLVGERSLSVERLFERLYRVARQVQAEPAQYPQRLRDLLQEVFEPLELQGLAEAPALSAAQVLHGGAVLRVPLTRRAGDAPAAAGASGQALELRYAHRGRRLFTAEDARLADRILEQLRRAVAYDTAVERGRSEERQRIAQDLHDDIGARLLTLMYQAPTPELEDYIRHTLQDLKTLTRGLAAAEHRLHDAAAEWKSDLSQRLGPARATLDWNFDADTDFALSVVQWSALTRVLRELVSNALFHGHATRVDVQLHLARGQLRLRVADDGVGRAPQAWSHGLGLGGVRKRVRLLGGEVLWRENGERGIACVVTIPGFAGAGTPAGTPGGTMAEP
jgi:signal transduction histidine kinase